MAEPLKYLYNDAFFSKLSNSISPMVEKFDEQLFMNSIYSNEWDSMELKERMRHVSLILRKYLNPGYAKSLTEIIKIIRSLTTGDQDEYGFEYMFFPDYIEVFGMDDHLISINAFETVTQFTSCEFAVRPYIQKHPELMTQQMLNWANHEHHMVRRLASEGCRPRLPWAMALPDLKKDPTPILPILDLLKSDESESVRRSVANNLNDISKDNPQIVIDLVKKWKGISNHTDRLVKHASRTLLKEGNTELMELFGFGSVKKIEIRNLRLVSNKVSIGDSLDFNFEIINTSNSNSLIRLEYAIYYQKANGSLSKKVYKISEKTYEKNSTTKINRKQHFKIITTRKLHLGLHQLALVVNGQEQKKFDFTLH